MVFDYYRKRITTFLADCTGFKKVLFEQVLRYTELYSVDKKSVDMIWLLLFLLVCFIKARGV